MLHHHLLILRKSELEIPSARTEWVCFFNPAFDKRTARFNLGNDLAPNLVNIDRRIIRLVTGVADAGAAINVRGYRIAAGALERRSYRVADALRILLLEFFIARSMVERFICTNYTYSELPLF